MGKALAHGLRKLQQWNDRLSQDPLGNHLLKTETLLLTNLLNRHLGKQAIVIGVPRQLSMLQYVKLPCHSLVTQIPVRLESLTGFIHGDYHELPILTGSVDLVVIPHTLEFIDNPHKVLSEACRIVKPEGLIAVTGFNPFSLWGAVRMLGGKKRVPWNMNRVQAMKVKSWLRLADFQMERHETALFTPPVRRSALYSRWGLMEKLGRHCFSPFGGVYVLIARAKVIPLTPIKLKWTQQLSDMRIKTTISGHIAR